MKYFSYLNSAAAIISSYQGQQPFHVFLKSFFKANKKYGSRDRKEIAQVCYHYFRLGVWTKGKPLADAIAMAQFLCASEPQPLLAAINEEWNRNAGLSLAEKCAMLQINIDALQIFPPVAVLSQGIQPSVFNLSHLVQPAVFLRVRPGRQEQVAEKLNAAGIPFKQIAAHCISVPAASKIDTVLAIDKEVVVQDHSSQRTGELLQLVPNKTTLRVWDCCAASGGKSLLAWDMLGAIDLTVSDIRPAVLEKLQLRLAMAGIHPFHLHTADLTRPVPAALQQSFDLIIADAPCTGSGTWGRTPERLSFFNKKEIDKYVQLQQQIVSNVLPCLRAGGYFLYITCSVFKRENEDMVSFIEAKGAHCLSMQLFTGYDHRADTLFAAMFEVKSKQ
ncbi:MAG TPA: hypothetical protein VL307_13955 [Chitinophagaceae bacterium]|nr:hypothetical protein [Chitinophagaceae bacterium]